MLFGRMCALGGRRDVAIMHERIGVARRKLRMKPISEVACVTQWGRSRVCGKKVAQVVRRVPGSDDQHVIRGQRGKRSAQFHVMCGSALGLHRDLHSRNIGSGKHMTQRHPRAVIETSATIDPGGDARLFQQTDDFFGERRRAAGRVLNLVKLRRESAEIVNRLRLRIAGDHRHCGFPMRRRDHYRSRFERLPERRPHTPRFAGRDRMHRRTVR